MVKLIHNATFCFILTLIVIHLSACHYISQRKMQQDAQTFAALKPILNRGDEKAKKALDDYLLSYQENAVGNPLAEMQESPYAAQAIDVYEAAYHRVQLNIRWHQAWRTLWTQGMKAGQKAFNRILKDYHKHARGNSYALHLKEAIHLLKQQQMPSQWTAKGVRWMGVAPGFCMAENEVSVQQYQQCMKAGACTEPQQNDRCLWGKVGMESMPINCVTWQQAQQYAQWVGGRLPRIAEWKYAFQAGQMKKEYPWGAEKARCVHGAVSGEEETCSDNIQSVCRFAEGRSQQGVCDLLGNVKEWLSCEKDCKSKSRRYIGSSWRNRVYLSAKAHQKIHVAPIYYTYYDLGIRPVSDCFDDEEDDE